MEIDEHPDGTVTWRGSFNRAQWDEYLAQRGAPAATEEGNVPEASGVQPPAGNASADEWKAYAVALGAAEEDVANLSRNDLRDKYGAS